ncbi:MAG: archease [Gammaproteobacteria bacterium]|nr:archease [Gammaproteobacteria bacterium]
MQRWEHFQHSADIGVRGLGDRLDDAFVQCAIALTAVVTEPQRVQPSVAVKIDCHSDDVELLLMEWLNALIYEMSVRKMLFARFDVAIRDGDLAATAWGEHIDIERHQPAVEPKGATLTELKVRETGSGWSAQCVIDV